MSFRTSLYETIKHILVICIEGVQQSVFICSWELHSNWTSKNIALEILNLKSPHKAKKWEKWLQCLFTQLSHDKGPYNYGDHCHESVNKLIRNFYFWVKIDLR